MLRKKTYVLGFSFLIGSFYLVNKTLLVMNSQPLQTKTVLTTPLVLNPISDAQDSVTSFGKYACKEVYCGGNKTISNMYNKKFEKFKSFDKKYPEKIKRFPRCIGIGLPKSGTTAMLKFLGKHPGMATAPYEINFFSDDQKYNLGLRSYLSKMPMSSDKQVTYEKSPLYGVSRHGTKVVNRIYAFDPDMKMLFMVRNPIDEAISGYLMFFLRAGIANGKTFEQFSVANGTINEEFYPITCSRYSLIIRPWLEKFSRDQIHIIDGDGFMKDPLTELKKIENFLNLEPFYTEEMLPFDKKKGFHCFVQNEVKECLGKGTGHVPPDIDPKVIQMLREYYRPYNEEFYKITGQKFDWDDTTGRH